MITAEQALQLLESTLAEHQSPSDTERWYCTGYESAIDDVISLLLADSDDDGLTDAQRARISIECEECGE